MEFVLVRHSVTPGNEEKRYIGALDQPLSQKGERLAKAQRLQMPQIDGLWVSPMLRCRQSASLLFPELEQRLVSDLRECSFGAFEGKTWEELKDEPVYRAWMDGDQTITFPNGESLNAFFTRCRRGIEQVISEGAALGIRRGALVAHGGTLMAVMSAFGRPERTLYDWQVGNCHGYWVRVEEHPLTLWMLREL